MNQIQDSEKTTRIVGICGSLREGSYTRKVVNIALQGAAEKGAETHLIDLRNYALPFCNGEEDESRYPPDVFKLREDVGQAQGIILGTPEYHSGMSGVLKNALDLMGFNQFGGKMVGLVGVSGGAMGAVNALNALRTVGRSLHAWVLPGQVSVPQASDAFDNEGKLKDSQMEDRLKEVGRQVAKFTQLHASRHVIDFLTAWESAPPNPGGE
ncbi:MAG TPA: NADPH-dependent oxidoreductase [Anaerolineae bacterium]|nr:NADPH-dependent oxidoreductase [Anaerolineae bacterium]